MANKVYCKNCKYNDNDNAEFCQKKVGKTAYNPYNGIVNSNNIQHIQYSENQNGDCKYYKKEWLKFWVK